MKHRLIPFLFVPILLTSCGNKAAASLPRGAKAASKEVITQKMNETQQTVSATDALSVSVKKAALDFSFVHTAKRDGVSNSSSLSLNVRDASMNLAAKGLTSTEVNDVQGSFVASAKVKLQVAGLSDLSVKMTDGQEKTFAVGAYLYQSKFFVDISNSAVYPFIKEVVSEWKGKSLALPEKFFVPSNLTPERLPLLSNMKNEADRIAKDSKGEIGFSDLSSPFYSFYTYANGDYAIQAKLTKEDIEKVVKNMPGFSVYLSDTTPYQFERAKFDAVAYFKKDGISFIGLTIDFKMKASQEQSTGVTKEVHETEMTMVSDFRIDFAYGDKVVVDAPKVEEYQPLPSMID